MLEAAWGQAGVTGVKRFKASDAPRPSFWQERMSFSVYDRDLMISYRPYVFSQSVMSICLLVETVKSPGLRSGHKYLT
jgi:hypothetical protein